MGTTAKVLSVIVRCFEIISAAVVAGLVGQYLHYVSSAHAHAEPRLVYTEVIAGISLLFAIAFMPPLKYSFYGFVLDFVLFICWMVAFGLLESLNGGQDCRSYWYWSSWGYYWGGYYYYVPPASATESLIGTVACSEWHAVLAFCFLGSIWWFITGCIGIYVCFQYPRHGTAKMNNLPGSPETKIKPNSTDVPHNSNVPAETVRSMA